MNRTSFFALFDGTNLHRCPITDTQLHPPHCRCVAAVVLQITHGYHLTEGEDPVLLIVEQALSDFSALAVPGAFSVDLLPIRQFYLWLLERALMIVLLLSKTLAAMVELRLDETGKDVPSE